MIIPSETTDTAATYARIAGLVVDADEAKLASGGGLTMVSPVGPGARL